MKLNTAEFRDTGELLFGSNWQTSLAVALLIDTGRMTNRASAVRAVQRWASDTIVPIGVWNDMLGLCRMRAARLRERAEFLRAAGCQHADTADLK